MYSKHRTRLTRRAALLGAMCLAGCGLEPVYGSKGSASHLRNSIAFDVPQTVTGYRLEEQLIRRLGRTDTPTYQLIIGLEIEETPVAISSDDSAARITLPAVARYALQDPSGQPITSGLVSSVTGYSATGNTFAVRSAEQDAYERLASALADLIVAQLLANTG